MFFVLLFAGITFMSGAFGQSDLCVPDPVQNLTLSYNGTLNWTAPINCNVSFYVIHITNQDGIVFHYDTENVTFNASFLPYCEIFQFEVTPVTLYNVQGISSNISSQVLPGPSENLTVNYFNVTASNKTHLSLLWEMPDGVEKCVRLFRVVVWDADRNTPYDVYVTENTFNFTDAVPCMDYEFGIRPIFDPSEDGPLSLYNYSFPGSVTTAPFLTAILEGVTSINMTWMVESYDRNRCNISALNIDASPNFNVSHPVQDTPERPPVHFEILNLEPNTVYVARVSVVNTAGFSPSVTVPVQTLSNTTMFD
ncbi:hypothetical protein NQ318_017904 [Aromia moschata]|uniref:Fibronectin type-III domain-containing protein n=1 Tax=Aromia moschata TaxID=1265417 RepID=A0AAV8YAV0_9CUCU|nr:hypothetical protein NQ318_017904 [Aromia moschata]